MAHEKPVSAMNPPFSMSIQKDREEPETLAPTFVATVSRDGKAAFRCHGSRDIRDLLGALNEFEGAVQLDLVETGESECSRFSFKTLKFQWRPEEGGESYTYTALLSCDGKPAFKFNRGEAHRLKELLGGAFSYVFGREKGLNNEEALRELVFRRERDHEWERER